MDAWLQCTSGASGDMLLGALLDAGASLEAVNRAVTALDVEHLEIHTEAVRRGGMAATKAHVIADERPAHRHWSDVRRLLEEAATLPTAVRDDALAVFARLADAEGRVHGVPADEVHFHEVGALDAIADVVGVCAAVHDLGLDRIAADTVAVGSGSVRTSHGTLGVPVPAVVALLGDAGAPVTAGVVPRELCTPTGAALLATLVDRWGPLEPMRVLRCGTGAGSADPAEAPNVLRVLLGQRSTAEPVGRAVEAVVLETNVDDLDPRLWPAVLDRLLAAGADDAWLTPILMKKGRPAHALGVLTTQATAAAVRDVVFRETSAIGLRETATRKHPLERSESVVRVDGHDVRVKQARWAGEVVNVQPEYDDVLAAAAATGRPAKQLLADAVRAAGGRD